MIQFNHFLMIFQRFIFNLFLKNQKVILINHYIIQYCLIYFHYIINLIVMIFLLINIKL